MNTLYPSPAARTTDSPPSLELPTHPAGPSVLAYPSPTGPVDVRTGHTANSPRQRMLPAYWVGIEPFLMWCEYVESGGRAPSSEHANRLREAPAHLWPARDPSDRRYQQYLSEWLPALELPNESDRWRVGFEQPPPWDDYMWYTEAALGRSGGNVSDSFRLGRAAGRALIANLSEDDRPEWHDFTATVVRMRTIEPGILTFHGLRCGSSDRRDEIIGYLGAVEVYLLGEYARQVAPELCPGPTGVQSPIDLAVCSDAHGNPCERDGE